MPRLEINGRSYPVGYAPEVIALHQVVVPLEIATCSGSLLLPRWGNETDGSQGQTPSGLVSQFSVVLIPQVKQLFQADQRNATLLLCPRFRLGIPGEAARTNEKADIVIA